MNIDKTKTSVEKFVAVWTELAPEGGSAAVAKELGITSSAVIMRAAYLVKKGVTLPKAKRLRAPRKGDVNGYLYLDHSKGERVVRYSSDEELKEKFEAMLKELVERRVEKKIKELINSILQ